MISQILTGIGTVMLWTGLALIFITSFGYFTLRVNKRVYTSKRWHGFAIVTASAIPILVANLLDGDAKKAAFSILMGALWGVTWWDRKRDDDDDDKGRHTSLKTVGEKTRAKLKEMADRLKRTPQPTGT